METFYKKGTPEEKGIPSQAILNFMEHIRTHKVELHSFWMQKEETCLAEAYYAPYHKAFGHRMYSISKTLTGLAIGFLEEEGKLCLEDKVYTYFLDKCPSEGVHPYIEEMTIRHLLTMTTAHQQTTYKRCESVDWVSSFFYVKPTHRPGTVFNYDTSASHVLAALVERLTHKKLLEYLRMKCLDEIGFSKEAKFLEDPYGISQGGSGLVCTMRDVAAFAYLWTQKGMFNGKQLLPKAYVEAATTKQVSTSMQPFLDEQYGYGYQIWMGRNGGFVFYGMGGQLAICLPETQFFMVTTAHTIGRPADLQVIYDGFYQWIYPYLMKPYDGMSDRSNETLERVLEHLEIPMLEGAWTNHTIYEGCYLIEENPQGIRQIRLYMDEMGGYIQIEGHETVSFTFAYGQVIEGAFASTGLKCVTMAHWMDAHTLRLRCQVIETHFSELGMVLSLQGEYLTIQMKRGIESFMADYDGILNGKRQ